MKSSSSSVNAPPVPKPFDSSGIRRRPIGIKTVDNLGSSVFFGGRSSHFAAAGAQNDNDLNASSSSQQFSAMGSASFVSKKKQKEEEDAERNRNCMPHRVPLLAQITAKAAEANRVTIHGEYAFEQPRQGVVTVDGVRLLMGQTTAGRELLAEELRRTGFHEKRVWPRPPSSMDAELTKRAQYDARVVPREVHEQAAATLAAASARNITTAPASGGRPFPSSSSSSAAAQKRVQSAQLVPQREMKKGQDRVTAWQSHGVITPEILAAAQTAAISSTGGGVPAATTKAATARPPTASLAGKLPVPFVPGQDCSHKKATAPGAEGSGGHSNNNNDHRALTKTVPSLFQDCVGASSALLYPAAGTDAASSDALRVVNNNNMRNNLPQTRVPRQYWITREHAVAQTVVSDSGSVTHNFDVSSVPVFPSDKPISRMELFALARTLDALMQERVGPAGFELLCSSAAALATHSETRGVEHQPGALERATKYVDTVRAVTDICDIGLCEVVRHTAASCIERGSLVDQLRGMLVALIGNLADRAENDRARMEQLRADIREVEAERDAARADAAKWRQVFFRVNAIGGTSAGIDAPTRDGGDADAPSQRKLSVGEVAEIVERRIEERNAQQQQEEEQQSQEQCWTRSRDSSFSGSQSRSSPQRAAGNKKPLPPKQHRSSHQPRAGAEASTQQQGDADQDDDDDDEDEVARERKRVFRWIDQRFEQRAGQARELAAAAEKHAALIRKQEAQSLTAALGDVPVEDDADALERELASQPRTMFQVLVGLLNDVHGSVTAMDALSDRLRLGDFALSRPARNVSVAVRKWRRVAQEVGRFKAEHGKRVPLDQLKIEFAQLPAPSVVDILFTLIELSSTLAELQLRLKAAAGATVLDRVMIVPPVPPERPQDPCKLCGRVAPPPESWGENNKGGKDKMLSGSLNNTNKKVNRGGDDAQQQQLLMRRTSSAFGRAAGGGGDDDDYDRATSSNSGEATRRGSRQGDKAHDFIASLGLDRYAPESSSNNKHHHHQQHNHHQKHRPRSPPLKIELIINCSCCDGGRLAPDEIPTMTGEARRGTLKGAASARDIALGAVNEALSRTSSGVYRGGSFHRKQHRQQQLEQQQLLESSKNEFSSFRRGTMVNNALLHLDGIAKADSRMFFSPDSDSEESAAAGQTAPASGRASRNRRGAGGGGTPGASGATKGKRRAGSRLSNKSDRSSAKSSNKSDMDDDDDRMADPAMRELRQLEKEMRNEEAASMAKLKHKLMSATALPSFLREGSFTRPNSASSNATSRNATPSPATAAGKADRSKKRTKQSSPRVTQSSGAARRAGSPPKKRNNVSGVDGTPNSASSLNRDPSMVSPPQASLRRAPSTRNGKDKDASSSAARMSSRAIVAASKASREQLADVFSSSSSSSPLASPRVGAAAAAKSAASGSGVLSAPLPAATAAGRDVNPGGAAASQARGAALRTAESGEFSLGFIGAARSKFPSMNDCRSAKLLFLAGMELNSLEESQEKQEQRAKMLAMAAAHNGSSTSTASTIANSSSTSNAPEDSSNKKKGSSATDVDSLAWPLDQLLRNIEECYDCFFEHGISGKARDLGEFVASSAAQRENIEASLAVGALLASCEKHHSDDERVANFASFLAGRTSGANLRCILVATERLNLQLKAGDVDADAPAKVDVRRAVQVSEEAFDLSEQEAVLESLREDLLRNCSPTLTSTDVATIMSSPDFFGGSVGGALAGRTVPLYLIQQVWRDLLENETVFKFEM